MDDFDRRTFVRRAAWSAPVIAAAIATPLAAASGPTETPSPTSRVPISCTPAGKNLWNVAYNDGTSATLHQGEVSRDKALQALCRDKGPQS